MPEKEDSTFEDLKGKTIVDISGCAEGSDQVRIATSGGVCILHHEQDCCESVSLAEIHGDPTELIGGTVSLASESSNSDGPAPDKWSESWTWTFYRLITDRGSLVMRWLGESNGYYSESVSVVWEASTEEAHGLSAGTEGAPMTREQVLEAEIERADREIECLTANRRKLQDELLALRSPFQIGDAVAWESSGRTWTGQVYAFGMHYNFKPLSWHVAKYRKDGTLGEAVAEVFELRRIEEGGDS